MGRKCRESVRGLEQMGGFMEKLISTSDSVQLSHSPRDHQAILESKLAAFSSDSLPPFDEDCQLEFIANFHAIQVGVRNQFGYVKAGTEVRRQGEQGKQPVSRPSTTSRPFITSTTSTTTSTSPSQYSTSLGYNHLSNSQHISPSNNLTSSLNNIRNHSLEGLSSSLPDYATLPGPGAPSEQHPTVCHPTNRINQQKLWYHFEFGDFGTQEGQFSEPNGVAITKDSEIVVADTNNHRIQVFDKKGTFKFQFGEEGRRNGQLFYPNKVAAVPSCGHIVVTERKTRQVRTRSGIFLKFFVPTDSDLHQVW